MYSDIGMYWDIGTLISMVSLGTGAIVVHLRRASDHTPYFRTLGLYGAWGPFKHLTGLFTNHPYDFMLKVADGLIPQEKTYGIALPIKEMGGRMQRSITPRFKWEGNILSTAKRVLFGKGVATHVIFIQSIETSTLGTIQDFFAKGLRLVFNNRDPSTYLYGMERGENAYPWFMFMFPARIMEIERNQWPIQTLGLEVQVELRCEIITEKEKMKAMARPIASVGTPKITITTT